MWKPCMFGYGLNAVLMVLWSYYGGQLKHSHVVYDTNPTLLQS